ncbi:MAG: glycosyltransferase family 4 protein [Methylocella sp.]
MKIVFICDFFLSSGGAAKIGLDLVQMLTAQNIPVKIFVGGSYDGDSTVPVVSLGQKGLLHADPKTRIFRGLFNATAHAELVKLIDNDDTPDTIYIVNSWFQILSPSIFAALNRVAKRVLVYAHDFFIACPNGGYFDFTREEPCDRIPLSMSCLVTQCDKRNYLQKIWRSGVSAMRRLTWNIERNGSRVVAVHEGMVDYLTKAGIAEKSISVVRNPSTPFTALPVKAECNREILYVGTLTEQKGFDVLIEALRERPWTANIFGEGDISVPADPHLIGHDFQPHDIIADAAARSRLFIMPSRQRETFGLAALEALGSGIPVIVSKQALLAADIKTHRCGLVLPAVDKSSVLKALDELFADDGRAAEFSRRAAGAHASISPSYQDWMKQILDVCASMLK